MEEQFYFNISLSTLNHLGRNLYRSIITIIGEAVSNSWDADANNVWITVDREKNFMSIIDDGTGMTSEDFQNKFLKIGYTKRSKNREGHELNSLSKSNRPFIGRKGIGKLALLSCSEKVYIISKTEATDYVGGLIDNSDLDKAIKNDVSAQDYKLKPVGLETCELKHKLENLKSGTGIYFENLYSGVFNTIDYLKVLIALHFQFSLFDKSFSIYVNDEKVTHANLSTFAEKTQFLWRINNFNDDFIKSLNPLERTEINNSAFSFKGYVTSVEKPSDLKIRGANEKLTIDLFVNGRLRKKDILEKIHTARVVENYLYGQIHYDELDFPEKDIFTSSREGVLSDEPIIKKFIEDFTKILNNIINEWDEFRLKHKYDGDSDNKRIALEQRKSEELINAILNKKIKLDGKDISYNDINNSKVKKWIKKLEKHAKFNTESYSECFISENLMRNYISDKNIPLTKQKKDKVDGYKKTERKNKGKANISFDIRENSDDLFYLDIADLAELIDSNAISDIEASLERSATEYRPIRNAVGHTSVLTDVAKKRLTTVYENIKARLLELLNTT